MVIAGESQRAVATHGRLVTLLMVLIGTAVLCLAVHRAKVASFTHDEAYSYLHYPHSSFADIISHKQAYTNNHLLNTLGMKYAEQLFGSSELALRLPNLLALVLYLVYAALLLRSLSLPLAVGGFALLCTNAYLMEFFTLARGYGLSFGFFMMAQYHLVRAITTTERRHLLLFHIASVLATLANFTLLTVFIAGLVVYHAASALLTDETSRQQRRRLDQQGLLMLVMSAIILYGPLRQVVMNNAFDFGGKSGFFANTVGTWVKSMLAGASITPALLLAMQVFIAVLVLLPVVLLVVNLARRNRTFIAKHAALMVIVAVLAITCAGTELQHALLGTDRLEARFALFLVPPLLLLIPYLLSMLEQLVHRAIPWMIMSAAIAWSVSAFVPNYGPVHSVEWGCDSHTRGVVTLRMAEHGRRYGPGEVMHIGNTWLFEPALNFYRQTWKLDWLEHADRDGMADDDEYRYVVLWETEPGYEEGFEERAAFPESATLLLRRMDTIYTRAAE